MLDRKKLLQSPNYWFTKFQNELFRQVSKYKNNKKITNIELAEELGVSKNCVIKILKGEFNYNLQTLIDISLAIGMIPKIDFVPVFENIEENNITSIDTYFNIDNCVNRLYKEWKRHPKLIIAVDFDDTLFDFHKNGNIHNNVFNILHKCKKHGFYVVLFSASKPERYPFMIEFLKEKGIEVNAINKNVIELPYGNNGKIYYNILLDDRAGLHQAYLTLSNLLSKIENVI